MLVDDWTNLEPTIAWIRNENPEGLVRVSEEGEGSVSTDAISMMIDTLDGISVGVQETTP